MKVGCQQCGASYSVADEKVVGRRLKLRCKKCGEPMIIDGSAGATDDAQDSFGPKLQVVRAPSAAPSAPSAPAGETEWYIAIDDNAQGPYTQHEMESHYAAGLITADTLVYREGLESWTAAGELPELSAFGMQSVAVAAASPSGSPVRTSMPVATFERAVPMGRDPFSESGPPYSPRIAAAELFLETAPREGTVQFSLDEMRALSAVSAPSTIAPPVTSKAGYASRDGSGLIDMRSLNEAAPAEDVYQPLGALQSPLDTMAPLALPARNPGGVDFRTKVLAGVASFGFLLMGAIGIFAITRTPPPQAVPAAATAQPNAAAAQPTAAVRAVAAEAKRAPAPAAGDAERAQAEERDEAGERAVADDEREDAPADKARKRSGPRRAAGARRAEPVERASAKSERGSDIDDLLAGKAPEKSKEKEKPAPSAAASKGGDDIDSLLLGALNGKKAAPAKAEPAAAESSLPKTPSREQMLVALGKAKAKVGKCKGPGVATAAITVAGSGRVSSVSVSGVEGGAKSCVESAVRSTPFPKFQQESFAVKFPFKLN